jgi:hypothetical protein
MWLPRRYFAVMTTEDDARPLAGHPDQEERLVVTRRCVRNTLRISDRTLSRLIEMGELAVQDPHKGRSPDLFAVSAVYACLARRDARSERERSRRQASNAQQGRRKGKGTK